MSIKGGMKMNFEISSTTATQLATLCKRAFFERVLPFAADEAEAHKMLRALEELSKVLAEQGFSPR
jgi:hypothetical protein